MEEDDDDSPLDSAFLTQGEDKGVNDDDDDATVAAAALADISISPAWNLMQRDLGITTPYLQPWMINMTTHDGSGGEFQSELKRRYQLLRPHVPKRFLLLYEIVRGHHDLGFGSLSHDENHNGNNGCDRRMDEDVDSQFGPPKFVHQSDAPALVVLVQSVESSIHHNIWTVELTDETGATVRAWMEPSFIHVQLQSSCRHQDDPSSKEGGTFIIRPGVVWLLRKVSIMPVVASARGVLTITGNGRLERMLLVSEQHIAKAWTPEIAIIDETKDTGDEQQKYLDWMQKRRDLTAKIAEEMEAVDYAPSYTQPRDSPRLDGESDDAHHEPDNSGTEDFRTVNRELNNDLEAVAGRPASEIATPSSALRRTPHNMVRKTHVVTESQHKDQQHRSNNGAQGIATRQPGLIPPASATASQIESGSQSFSAFRHLQTQPTSQSQRGQTGMHPPNQLQLSRETEYERLETQPSEQPQEVAPTKPLPPARSPYSQPRPPVEPATQPGLCVANNGTEEEALSPLKVRQEEGITQSKKRKKKQKKSKKEDKTSSPKPSSMYDGSTTSNDIWNMTADESILQMFEEDDAMDDAGNHEAAMSKSGRPTDTASIQNDIPISKNDNDPSQQASQESDNEPETVTTTTATNAGITSIFEASNWEGVDLNDFDD